MSILRKLQRRWRSFRFWWLFVRTRDANLEIGRQHALAIGETREDRIARLQKWFADLPEGQDKDDLSLFVNWLIYKSLHSHPRQRSRPSPPTNPQRRLRRVR